jgi:hypothetical protein
MRCSPGHWKSPQGDRQYRSGSPSSPMPRLLSSVWPRRSPAQDSYMPSRLGGTSQSCGGPDQTSPSRSDGAQPIRGSPATGKPTNGPSLQPKNRTLEEWSGYGADPALCRSRDLSHTSSVLDRSSPVGWRPDLQEEIQDAGQAETRRNGRG